MITARRTLTAQATMAALLGLTLVLLGACKEPTPESSSAPGAVPGQQAPAAVVNESGPRGDIRVEYLVAHRDDFALVLDVRTPGEYTNGHVPGAINIPLDQLQARLPELETYKDQNVAVICQSGRRSATATDMLRKSGFGNAHNVLGGTGTWVSGRNPVNRGEAP